VIEVVVAFEWPLPNRPSKLSLFGGRQQQCECHHGWTTNQNQKAHGQVKDQNGAEDSDYPEIEITGWSEQPETSEQHSRHASDQDWDRGSNSCQR
jgi:hypothetical protein